MSSLSCRRGWFCQSAPKISGPGAPGAWTTATLQIGPLLDERAEQGAERRRVLGGDVRAQADAAVEIPSDDEDRPLGFPQGSFEMREVWSPVDQNTCSVGLSHAPAVPPGTQNRVRRRSHRRAGDVGGLQARRFFQKSHVSHVLKRNILPTGD